MPEPLRVSRRRAVRILEEERAELLRLVAELPARARTAPGLGGGDWSPKDLIAHLETWEEFALEALRAWDEGHGPAFERVLWSRGTNAINRDAYERKAHRSYPETVRRADRTHAELIARIEAMSDARWNRPGTPRGRSPAGQRIGGILGGPQGPFRHAQAHLKDLRGFVEGHRAGRLRA